MSIPESAFLIGLIGLGVILFATITTLVVVGAVWRDTRSTSKSLTESHARLETELKYAREERYEARRKVQQLEEGRSEKLEWELQHATEERERLRQENLEAEREAERQRQELLHQIEQHKQQRLRLEQESRNLMEELERWRWRYVEAQQQADQLEGEQAEDRRKIEQLTQLRKRLLEELREIGSQ